MTPRRPERDRGRASPGQYLGGGAPLARNWRPQRLRPRGPAADCLDCACLWAGRALVRRGAGLDTSSKHKANPPYPGGGKRTRRSISEYRPTKSAERPAHSAPRPCHQCPTTKPAMKITVGTSDRWSRFVLNDHSWKATTEKKRPKTTSAGRQPNRAKRAAYRPRVHGRLQQPSLLQKT